MGTTGIAVNAAMQILPVVIDQAPKVMKSVRETFATQATASKADYFTDKTVLWGYCYEGPGSVGWWLSMSKCDKAGGVSLKTFDEIKHCLQKRVEPDDCLALVGKTAETVRETFATLTQLNATFGTTDNHKGQLFDYVRAGKSDVVVYYSGHGVPGLRDRKGYLLPVNADPNRAELNGYPLDTLLANLGKIPARSMAVYLDACFSGESAKGTLVRATSGITVQAKVPNTSTGMVVVTAARSDQFASWDEDAKHGLFTKHLLAALRGKADGAGFGNGDGKVTLAELKSYLDEEMTYQARRRWSRDQNASIQGDLNTVLATQK